MTTQSDLSAEAKLVLSRSWMDDAGVAAIKSLQTISFDWDSILQSGTRHGIAPLLYRTLSRIDDDSAVPPEVRATLRTAYYNNIARNMLLYQELRTVLKAFNVANIDVIVLKGAFLAELVYENIGLRAIGDIDLLVKREDLEKVKQELIQLGYHALPTKWGERLNELWETEWAEERHYTKANNVDIDVHWYIQDRVDPYQIADFWVHAQPVVLAGEETLMLAPEDQMLHRCLHSERHMRNTGAVFGED
jgi:hypothetical protein